MNKQVSASLFSTSVLAAALGVLWLGYFLSGDTAPKLEMRKVDVVMPPPPPPPPPQAQQQVVETQVSMQIEGKGPSLQMAELKTDINIEKPTVPDVAVTPTRWPKFEVEWQGYKLSELDGLPTLLTPVRVKFPKSLKRQGITKAILKLDVMIDEQGNVRLIDIVENPYQELEGEIRRMVKFSKFTAPQKDQQTVKARFIWPLEIEA